MNGQSEDPPRIDLRDGKGVQVGPGINVQFNDFHFPAAGSPRRPVRLPPVRTVSEWKPFDLGIWESPVTREICTLRNSQHCLCTLPEVTTLISMTICRITPAA